MGEVGSVAQRAGVRALAVSHLTDFSGYVDTAKRSKPAGNGYDGQAAIGTGPDADSVYK
ncbi:hypothetical protein G3I59_09230 [Amycolatopsis rubida]|uniref:Uncharacterized protein n=1 Tax=Amycolatopsis rubida TaxID=112413 RepID=A0ABX0BMP6_9PSEU|nr:MULTISPECIES: hypothetical protein [Amycolatopsis]MYW90786.1 hypothetical protein [Amycolatopsis rubida]NEC55769.1 hypothetical protein [Amycolatopsis rubida]